MGSVSLQIDGLPNTASGTRKQLPFAEISEGTLVIKSQLGSNAPLNDHLVWLWGLLKHERRYLKSLQSEGGTIMVQAVGFRLPVEIRPNGAELLHLLGANLIVADSVG